MQSRNLGCLILVRTFGEGPANKHPSLYQRRVEMGTALTDDDGFECSIDILDGSCANVPTHHGKNRSVIIPYNPFLSVSVRMISGLQAIIIIYMGLSRFCFYRDAKPTKQTPPTSNEVAKEYVLPIFRRVCFARTLSPHYRSVTGFPGNVMVRIAIEPTDIVKTGANILKLRGFHEPMKISSHSIVPEDGGNFTRILEFEPGDSWNLASLPPRPMTSSALSTMVKPSTSP